MAGYRIQKVETLYEGWRRLLKVTVEMPDGRTMAREVLNSTDAAAVLPYDPETRKVILIRQFRAPVMHVEGHPDFLEAVAGLLDGDEPEACARRETMEEAGLRITELEPVGTAWSAPGMTTERLHLFLAPYTAADRVGEGGGLAEEHEEIEVLEIGLDELMSLLERGAIADMKTLALVQALQLRHPELFQTR
ncbi:NUDIX domain-containing protein [Microvirga sp. CF3016]|uniref:NUDIX domain-containing protein n=1 Tax=Microvirga sp. CF3016 TaxID=3110181 RepID=UPI002E77A9C9|nr:NUDIX domain-containing protein [Microvirga sp. CF3016]MEE1612348.1 NUDIX domain-containing protein [Microvirga sp. CF3016]